MPLRSSTTGGNLAPKPADGFLLDEDIPRSLCGELIGRGYVAVTAHDLGLQGAGDIELSLAASSRNLVLLTKNVRSYSDTAYQSELAWTNGLVVACVRMKADDGPAQDQVCRDLIHRYAHRLLTLTGDAPVLAILGKGGVRLRRLSAK